MNTRRQALNLLIYLVLATSSAFASSFFLPSLNDGDIQPVTSTIASDLVFRPVEPSSSFGKIWGLSAGVIGSLSSTSRIQYLIGNNPSTIPGGALYLALQLPYGIAIETGLLPNINISALNVYNYGGDVRWTLSDALKYFPLDVAARIMMSWGGISYNETLSGGNLKVDTTVNTFGLNLQASKIILAVFEPYGGVGFISQSSTLTAVGTTSLFGASFPTGTTKATSSDNSVWWILGIKLHPLPVFGIGFEYDNAFGISSALAKVSLTI